MPLKSRDVIDVNDPRVAQIGHPAPPWLINYADLMTELVCFFVIMYSLNVVLDKKVNEVAKKVEEQIKSGELSGTVKYTPEGLQITLNEKGEFAFFESGKAELMPKAKESIDKLVPELLKLPNEIVIQGHTDDVPIKTSQFSSNWELSTARATNVVKYLNYEKKIPPQRLSAIGYGEYKPIVLNDTPENKTKNRRVVFLIKNLSQEEVWKKSEKIK
ncbi:MAG: flagellar motor protein MotB [Candidatus Firestonebacteria bacterium]